MGFEPTTFSSRSTNATPRLSTHLTDGRPNVCLSRVGSHTGKPDRSRGKILSPHSDQLWNSPTNTSFGRAHFGSVCRTDFGQSERIGLRAGGPSSNRTPTGQSEFKLESSGQSEFRSGLISGSPSSNRTPSGQSAFTSDSFRAG